MLDRLKKIVDTTNSRVIGQVINSRANADLAAWIEAETSSLNATTISEKIAFLLEGKPNIICKNGNKKSFSPKKKTFGFCDNVANCACFREHLSALRTDYDMSAVVSTRVDTWINKYGVDNPSKVPSCQQKRLKTISANPNTTALYKKLALDKKDNGFVQIAERVKDYVLPLFAKEDYNGSKISNKYSWKCKQCDHIFSDHVDSGRIPKCKKCYPHVVSCEESNIAEFIESLGFTVLRNSKSILGNLEIDIYVPDKKIAFEYNGVYWHSSKFKNSKYHVSKYLKSKDLGIHLIQIFEDEWLTKKDIVKNRIKSLLGKEKAIGARKCTISTITGSEYKKFTEQYHLQGWASATHKFGLFFENNLIAVMSFSKSRYTKNGYELIRYCSNGNVVGGASKLFKHFISELDPDEVTSYANRCWSNGNMYERIGFSNTTQKNDNVGYWYIKNNVRYHRSNFTKAKLISAGEDSMLSESEIMKNNGYVKIYDCGNYRYTWKKGP